MSARITELNLQIEQQRRILDSNETDRHRAAELVLERLEHQLKRAEESAAAYEERSHEIEEAAREREARRELERELMDKYIASAPGTTKREARKALPKLLEQYRLDQMNRVNDQVRTARRSPAYRV